MTIANNLLHEPLCVFADIYLVKITRREIAVQRINVILLVDQISNSVRNLHCFSHQKEANITYNCENLGLAGVPDTLPNTTKFLKFGFNFLPTLENTTFSRLVDLIFLDLTRYVSEFLICSWYFTYVITQLAFKLFPGSSFGSAGTLYPSCLLFPMKCFYAGEM